MPTISEGTRIHFGRGTFLTRGIRAKESWRISGAGKDLTTIRLADGTAVGDRLASRDPSAANYTVISKYFDNVWLNHFELSDLTLDCNREKQPIFIENLNGFALNAYTIAAKNAKITNVRALGTWARPGEGFSCIVMHDGTSNNVDRIEISGVENIHPIGYLSAIGVIDQGGGTYTGFIRNCVVTDHYKGSALGAAASHDFKIYNNYTHNVNIALNFDTYPATNLDIYGNHFHNTLVWGVLLNNASLLRNIKIHGNYFEMSDTAGPVFLAGQVSANVQIFANEVVQHNPKGEIFAGSPKLTGVFHDNVISGPERLDLSSVPNLVARGNRAATGGPIATIKGK